MVKKYIVPIILLVSSFACIHAMYERDGVYRGPVFGNAQMDFFAGNRPLQIVPSQGGGYRPPALSEPEQLVMTHCHTETPEQRWMGMAQMARREEQPARTITFMHGGHAVRFKDCTISPAREIEQRQSVQLGEACIQNCRVQQSLQRGQCVIDKCDAAWQSAVVDRSKLDSLLSKLGSERQELEAFARGETGATEQEARAALSHFDQRRHEIEHKLQEAEWQLASHVERYMSSYVTKNLEQQVEEQVKLICEEKRCAPQLEQAEGERDCKERHKDYWKGCQEEYNRIHARLLPRFGKWIAQTYGGWRGQDNVCPEVISRNIGRYTQELERAQHEVEGKLEHLAETRRKLAEAKVHTHQIIKSQSAGELNKQYEYFDRCLSERGYEISADQSMNRVRRELLQQNKQDIANELRERSYSTEHQQVIKEMIQQLEQQREQSPLSMREQARLDVAHKTLQSNGALFVQTYEIIEPTRALLKRAGINPEDISVFVGIDLQLNMVDDNFKTLDRLGALNAPAIQNKAIDDMVLTGTHNVVAAMDLAREGCYQASVSFDTIVQNLTNVVETLIECDKAIVRGGAMALHDTAYGLLHAVKNPVQTIKSISNATKTIAIETSKLANYGINDCAGIMCDMLGYHEQAEEFRHRVRLQDEEYAPHREAAYRVAHEFMQLPLEQKFEKASYEATRFFVDGLMFKGVGRGLARGARAVAKLPTVQRACESIARVVRQPLFKTQLFIAAETADLTPIGNQLVGQGLKDFVAEVRYVTGGAVSESEILRAAMALENPIKAAMVETCNQAAKNVVRQYESAIERLRLPVPFDRDTAKIIREWISPLKFPQGLSEVQFAKVSELIKDRVSHISDDVFVQGSRAKGTAALTSDIDFGIRVSPEKFDKLIKECFGRPNSGTAAERTMFHAMKTGKIHAGEAKLRPFRKELKALLGMKVDLSVIKAGGQFDQGPFITLS